MTDIDDILYSPISKPEIVNPQIPADVLHLFTSLGQYLQGSQRTFRFPNDDRARTFYKGLAEQYIAGFSDILYSFSITCDATNNPPIVIDCGKIIVDVLVQPYGSCGSYTDRVIF